jgi:two-component system response regulator HydG
MFRWGGPAAALAQGEFVALEDLPGKIQGFRPHRIELRAEASADPLAMPSMEEIEWRYIRQVLDAVNGNKALAAQILGFDRRTLYRKLERMAQKHKSDEDKPSAPPDAGVRAAAEA